MTPALFHSGVLSQLFAGCLEKLAAAHRAGELQFFGNHTSLTQGKAFTAFLATVQHEMVCLLQASIRWSKQVLRYLAAIPIRRDLEQATDAADETGVTFKYKDYRIEGLPVTRP